MDTNDTYYAFSEDVIAQIANVLTMALCTASDITDHLRNFRMIKDDTGRLILTDEYLAYYKNLMIKLEEEARQNLNTQSLDIPMNLEGGTNTSLF